jgi:hypothetical protein
MFAFSGEKRHATTDQYARVEGRPVLLYGTLRTGQYRTVYFRSSRDTDISNLQAVPHCVRCYRWLSGMYRSCLACDALPKPERSLELALYKSNTSRLLEHQLA